MAQMGKLDDIRAGFAEGLSDAVKASAEKISNNRLQRVFNSVSKPLEPMNEFAMAKNASFGQDMGSYLTISEAKPNGNGETLQTIEIGNGVTYANLAEQEYGVRPSGENIKIEIQRDANGESQMSAFIRGKKLEGFESLPPKEAARMIGQMAGQVQLGQQVSVSDGASRLANAVRVEQSKGIDPGQRGTFKLSDIQQALRNTSP